VSVLSTGLTGVGDPEAVGVVGCVMDRAVVDGHGWFSFVSVMGDAAASIIWKAHSPVPVGGQGRRSRHG
jgi:hypothetical protein